MSESKLRDLSMEFSVDIIELVKYLKSVKESIISNQIGRSGTSIGANIHEANYAQGKRDFVSKLEIALKEASETGYWLELLYRTKYIDEQTFKTLSAKCTSLRAMLIASCRTAKGERKVIIQKDGYVLDVDIEATRKYSQEHSLCNCDEDRNLYAQVRSKFPELTTFLAELGLLIDRPDETGSCAMNDYIDYHFVAYTVIGNILESDKYEIDMFDGGLFLNIVIDNWYIPNEQKTDRYFTVTVFGIDLPWVLDEPFPESTIPNKGASIIEQIKKLFSRN